MHGCEPLRRNVAAVPCVVRCGDREQRVAMIERVHVDRRRLTEQVERRMTEPVPVVDEPTAEGEAKQRIRTSLSDRSRHGLEQRPCPGISPHENLPTPLHPETGVDEKSCVPLDARIRHGARS